MKTKSKKNANLKKKAKKLHTFESSRKIRNKTESVKLESCGHRIRSMKLKIRPCP